MVSAATQDVIQVTRYSHRDTVKELDRYRNDYSYESGQLVGEIKSLMINAQDSYYSATQSVYEFCGVATQLLDRYGKLFEQRSGDTYAQQRAILIQVLDVATKKMTTGQEELLQSNMHFNNASAKLKALHNHFTNEFDSKSSYYQSKVDQIRTEAYAAEAAGVVGGPFGLLISNAIATETVERKLIPELNEKLRQTKNFFDHLKSLIEQTDRDIDSSKGKLDGEIKMLPT